MKAKLIDPGNSEDARSFIELPYKLYKDSPFWVPPLESELQLVLNKKKHPFFTHSEGDFFIVENEGQVLGRIAVLSNRNFNQHHNLKSAFFYYFESIEDPEVASVLFIAAEEWARSRSLNLMLGPKGFLRSNCLGMLVEGFDHLPAMGMTYNPPFYSRFLEASGYSKETDHLSGYIGKEQGLPTKLYEVAEKVKKRGQFWVKTFRSRKEMRAWIPVVDKVHSEAFSNNPGYYPSTAEEFEMLASTMIQIADPRLVKVIMSRDEVAGFILSYANVNLALQKVKGRLWPFGWAHILLAQKRTKLVDLNGVGLMPRFQGLGANALLYTELEKTLKDFQFELGEIVQVDERNFKSKSDMETMQVHWAKRHRTYRKVL